MMHKYPRTPHLQGSRLQPGDEDLQQIPLHQIAGEHLVVEEKVDGANAGISFDHHRTLQLQSRGHFLTGGPREKQFALFKTWAATHKNALWDLLGSRYLVFGEWLYAKHTIYYDNLPHYFLEFDIYDRQEKTFLDTPTRHHMLKGSPIISVPVLWQGQGSKLDIKELVTESTYKSNRWKQDLLDRAHEHRLDSAQTLKQTDPSSQSEGLYIKVERDGATTGRLKWIRPSFLTAVIDSGSHWLDRPILPNRLAQGVDIYAS